MRLSAAETGTVSPDQKLNRTTLRPVPAEPSRAFGCAALLGLAGALPGFVYVGLHVLTCLPRGRSRM